MSTAGPHRTRQGGVDGVNRAAEAIRLLTSAGASLAVAESLTGGAVAAAIVDVPGASAALRGGVVAYATDLKARLLDVPADLLHAHGPVHPEVALAMARGVRARLDATWGLATTGVAGPDPQDGRPPGEYHVAVVGPGAAVARSVAPSGTSSRAQVRAAARDAALTLLVEVLRGGAADGPGDGPDDGPDDGPGDGSGDGPADEPVEQT